MKNSKTKTFRSVFTLVVMFFTLTMMGQVKVDEDKKVLIGNPDDVETISEPDAKLHIIETGDGPALEITKKHQSPASLRFSKLDDRESYSQLSVSGSFNQALSIELDVNSVYGYENFEINKNGGTKLYNINRFDEHSWYRGGEERMIFDRYNKLLVRGSLRIDAYSPVIYLRRNSNTGGFIQGIQTQLQDGTNNLFFGGLGAGTFAVKNGNYGGLDMLRIIRGSDQNNITTITGRLKIIETDDNTAANEFSNAPLSIPNKKNSVSMFLGKQENATTYGSNDVSGDIRFNGVGVASGDFGYYPNGGGDEDFGHFRFSKSGGNISTSPNAKIGVGALYVEDDADINGAAKVTGKLTLENVMNLTPMSEPSSAEIGDIYLDDGDGVDTQIKLRCYTASGWIDL